MQVWTVTIVKFANSALHATEKCWRTLVEDRVEEDDIFATSGLPQKHFQMEQVFVSRSIGTE